jgi:hypothetical protein
MQPVKRSSSKMKQLARTNRSSWEVTIGSRPDEAKENNGKRNGKYFLFLFLFSMEMAGSIHLDLEAG